MLATQDLRPIIVSLRFDDGTFVRLDALRRTHFPADRNHLPAHLTLFHHLPGVEQARVITRGRDAAQRPPVIVTFAGVRFLGAGVALNVASADLLAVRAQIAQAFTGGLTPQDSQAFRPHVTLQNKAKPPEARALFDRLSASFTPWTGKALGLDVWFYANGPWELIAKIPFLA